jgi:tRNA dimethylallyltransferase
MMTIKESKTIICLMGPTASGKTQLAIELLKQGPFEIISVDSAMVYRGMDIGTAKPEPAILDIAPHRLIDQCEPYEIYSAARFRIDACREIEQIVAQGKIPLLVGGSMLYFKALQEGLSNLPAANPVIRAELLAEAAQTGWEALHKRLQQIDPVAAARIHPNDPQRLQRALEIYLVTGKSMTQIVAETQKESFPYKAINLILFPSDRLLLRATIAQRFRQMLTKGLVAEVEQLKKDTRLTLEKPSMKSVGYRQVWLYLEGKLSYQEMQERGIIATQQLAKRQLTWARTWPGAILLDTVQPAIMNDILPFLKG